MNMNNKRISFKSMCLPFICVSPTTETFPTILEAKKYYNWLLTLGFLEVVEMEYDEGSE